MPTHPLLIGATLLLGALTPAKVDNVNANPNAAPPPQPPYVIYVDSFSMDPILDADGDGDPPPPPEGRPHLLGFLRGGSQNTILGRRKQDQYNETLQKLPGILQKALIENLAKAVAPATNGNGVHAKRWDCWVVTGQFIVVNPGDRAMQAGIGFGAGQSHLEVQAQVYALRDMHTPFLVFNSQGASGHMPGAVMMMNPYVAAAKFVMSKNEPEKEARKVAKAIAQEIGKFMTAQGIPTLKEIQSGNVQGPTPSTVNHSSKTNQ